MTWLSNTLVSYGGTLAPLFKYGAVPMTVFADRQIVLRIMESDLDVKLGLTTGIIDKKLNCYRDSS